MAEATDLLPIEKDSITSEDELTVFTDLIAELDAIPENLKEELQAEAGGKFGSTADMEGEFAGRKN